MFAEFLELRERFQALRMGVCAFASSFNLRYSI